MSLNVGGVASVVVFYLLILIVGIWVGWKQKRKLKRLGCDGSENMMLAGRDLGLFVGVLTMTGNSKLCLMLNKNVIYFAGAATWVAGGYINGTCEGAFTGGLVRASTLCVGCSLSLIVGT